MTDIGQDNVNSSKSCCFCNFGKNTIDGKCSKCILSGAKSGFKHKKGKEPWPVIEVSVPI